MSGIDASPGGTTINFPGPPAFEQHVTTHGLEYGTLSPEQQQNFDQRGALEQQQADTIERERKQQAQADAIDAQHKRYAGEAMQAIEDEKSRRSGELQKSIGTWQNRLEGAYQKAQSAPAPSLFADSTTSEKAMRGFGLMMAGIGDALTAYGAARTGRGVPTHSFADIVDYDLGRQREKIAKLKDDVITARTGVKDAQDARQVAMAELDAKGAGFMKRLEAMAAARLASLKEGDQGFIPAQKAMAAAKEERLKYQQQSLAPLTIKHQGPTVENTMRDTKPPGGKPLNDIVMGDPLNPAEAGKPLGEVSSGRGGAQAFSQTDTGIHTAIDALKALHADIEKNGERPTSLAAIKHRDALRANSTLQVGAVSTAGQSDLALSTEAATIGARHNPVVQWVAGENPEAIKAKIHELENRVVRNRGQGLLPMSDVANARLGAKAPPPAPLIPAGPPTPAGTVPPAPPPATAPASPRQQYVEILKRQPAIRNTPKGRRAMEIYNITEADLGR